MSWATWFESLWMRRGGGTAGSERPNSLFQLERTVPRVPVTYLSLYTYLEHRYASIVVLTFEEMEALLGFALPAMASTEPEWWNSGALPAHGYSKAWTEAGRTAIPNLVARTVTFERLAGGAA
jgi:hypothetical protein